ncbi:MAG: hypothetical protein RLZZ480_645 [Candidatus Parcubacteria bacterium]|jgi:CYTH domain-containing protein/predicted ATPase
MLNIPKIVVTGGPSAGKTSGLAAIVQFCENNGFCPVVIPEVATELITSGFDRRSPSFQDFVMEKILFEEHLRLQGVANGHFPPKTVLIFDRGLCDSEAYVGREMFLEVLKRHGLSLVDARDRYNGVIFLDSAACGAEEFYTTENNDAREEGLEEARLLNERTKDAWMGTPHFVHVPNRPGIGFDDKITECLRALARILGVPEPVEHERKFLLKEFDLSSLPNHSAPIDIIQTYLVSAPGQVERVRARGQHNSYRFFNTTKVRLPGGGSHELDHLISRDAYNDLLIRRDPLRIPVHKTRYCFRHAHHYCELDVFHGHRSGLALLEVEVHSMDEPVEVPPFIGPYEDVTDVDGFANYDLALPV